MFRLSFLKVRSFVVFFGQLVVSSKTLQQKLQAKKDKHSRLEENFKAELAEAVEKPYDAELIAFHDAEAELAEELAEARSGELKSTTLAWMLDMSRYLQEWLGNLPIGVELGDFFPTTPFQCRCGCNGCGDGSKRHDEHPKVYKDCTCIS